MSGNDSSTTLDSTSGLLTIGQSETNKTISVTATLEGAKLNADKNALESVSKTETIGIDLGTVGRIELSPKMPDNKYYIGQTITFTKDAGTSNNLTWKVSYDLSKVVDGHTPLTVTNNKLSLTGITLFSDVTELPITLTPVLNGQEDTSKKIDITLLPFNGVKTLTIAGVDGTTVAHDKTLQIKATITPEDTTKEATNSTIEWTITGHADTTGTKIEKDGDNFKLTIGNEFANASATTLQKKIYIQATIKNGKINNGSLTKVQSQLHALNRRNLTPPLRHQLSVCAILALWMSLVQIMLQTRLQAQQNLQPQSSFQVQPAQKLLKRATACKSKRLLPQPTQVTKTILNGRLAATTNLAQQSAAMDF